MTDFSQVKKELLARKQELEKRLKKDFTDEHDMLSHSTGELSQYDNHPADTATDLYEREKDMALEVHLANEYEEVEKALQKIKDGTYGICEVSGELIPYERLEANPTARTIVTAADHHIPADRPVEEEVLGGFNKYNFDDRDDETEFDAEDAYQSVARFNDNSMTYEGSSLDETDELIGSVEQIEAFISTGMDGSSDPDHIQIQRNVHYDKYVENETD